MNRIRIRRCGAVLAVTCALVGTAACAQINVKNVPVPGTTVGDGYNLTLQFSSVLNLPERARVVFDGTRVGRVTRLHIAGSSVDVEIRVESGVAIPANIHAVLQQDTILGDTYVALLHDENDIAAPKLTANATVPVTQTSAPPQLEDTIAVLATFITSGSIQRAQTTISRLNAVTPADNIELQGIVHRVATDLGALSDRLDEVDTWLDGVDRTAADLHEQAPVLAYFTSPAGQLSWYRNTFGLSYMGKLLPSIGSIYQGGFWLVPMLHSLVDATGALEESGTDILGDGPAWLRLLTEQVLPFAHDPSIDVSSITTSDGRDLTGDITAVLRMLGAIR
ncbi:MlaD family protein [Nocardia nepalensis]|uniref:MlaD family protein n=1 Tax=Nocardia nepalensis TaxID=3375448 RepID=UPI003B681CC4